MGISFSGPFEKVGPPKELMLAVSAALGAKTFVESGTYHAETALWASEHFEKVYTVEALESLFRENVARYGAIANISFRLGDSPPVLREVLAGLDAPAVFWLDAHWSGGTTYGEENQCPLLAELREVVKCDPPHCLFIDDARMFLSPPPLPCPRRQWPDLDDICAVVSKGRVERRLILLEDVLIFYPPRVEDLVRDWVQKSITDKMERVKARMKTKGPSLRDRIRWKAMAYAKKALRRP